MTTNKEIGNTATARVTQWLGEFEKALKQADADEVASLFAEECFWRDLIAFTWNIKTMEGKGAIHTMVAACATDVKPTHWRIEREATETDGITEAWFTFETTVSRGKGHLRLKNELCWTLLTTMVEIKGHEEKKGEQRIKGVEHNASKNRLTCREGKTREEKLLGYDKQPYCLIIGGGQGGIVLAPIETIRRSHYHY